MMDLNKTIEALQERVAELEFVIEMDRSKLSIGVDKLKGTLEGRAWMAEGRGSFEWNDDKYQQEFHDAAQQIRQDIQGLEKISRDWTNCPKEQDNIRKARVFVTEYDKCPKIDKDRWCFEMDKAPKDEYLLCWFPHFPTPFNHISKALFDSYRQRPEKWYIPLLNDYFPAPKAWQRIPNPPERVV